MATPGSLETSGSLETFRYSNWVNPHMDVGPEVRSTIIKLEKNIPLPPQSNLERLVGRLLELLKNNSNKPDIIADMKIKKSEYRRFCIVSGLVALGLVTLAKATQDGPAALVLGAFGIISSGISYDNFRALKCAEIIIKAASQQSSGMKWAQDLKKEADSGLYLRLKANQPYIESPYLFW